MGNFSERLERAKESLRFNFKYNKRMFFKAGAIFIIFVIAFCLFLNERNKEGQEIFISEGDYFEENISDNGGKSVKEGENEGSIEESGAGAKNVEETEEEIKFIYVDVSGAVTTPGVVQLPEGSRVFNALELAGGLLKNADTRNVNLAAVVKDGDKLLIPTAAEIKKDKTAGGIVTNTIAMGKTTGNKVTVVNINSASSEELQTLSGVGPATAEKIIEYRNKNGSFKSINELMNVSGIGTKTLEKFKDKISI